VTDNVKTGNYSKVTTTKEKALVHTADGHPIVSIIQGYSFSAAQEYVVTSELVRGDKTLNGLHHKFGFANPFQMVRGHARQ